MSSGDRDRAYPFLQWKPPDLPNEPAIPRMLAGQHEIDMDALSDSDEIFHDVFPLKDFLGDSKLPVRRQFARREIGRPSLLVAPPRERLPNVQIPEMGNSSIEKCVIHMLDIPIMFGARHKGESYIHTWCDITTVTSIEAKRVVAKFFAEKYKAIETASNQIRTEVSWSEDCSHSRVYTRTVRAIAPCIRIFHYIGLGLPEPEGQRIWMRDPTLLRGGTALSDLKYSFAPPCMLIFDCGKAAVLRTFLGTQQKAGAFDLHAEKTFFVLFACSQTEQLHIPTHLPQNLFSCILLSPELAFSALTGIVISENNVQMFNVILDLFTESIALDSLHTDMFYKIFRTHSSVATLWRRFIFAQRLMKRFGLHPRSIPELGDMTDHELWRYFDYAILRIEAGTVIIDEIVEMYLDRFRKVTDVCPPKFVCAVVATLQIVQSQREKVWEAVANFMMRSPDACRLMVTVINAKLIGDYSTACKGSSSSFRNWAAVVSGLLLAAPSLAKGIKIQLQDGMKVVLSEDCDDLCKALILSILVCIKDSQARVQCFIDSDTTGQLTPVLFKTAPAVREWTAIMLHAAIARCQAEPRSIGASGIHVYAMLLLYDVRRYTRAAAVGILSCLMTPCFPEFNASVVKSAMKAVIDGSNTVRISVVQCIAHYYDLCDSDELVEGEWLMDYFIRENVVEYADSEIDYQALPLRQSLLILAEDPCEHVRKAAAAVLRARESGVSAAISAEDGLRDDRTYIHRLAHVALFSRASDEVKVTTRYETDLFDIDELELFEVFNGRESPMTTVLGFDEVYGNVYTCSNDGYVVWNDHRWKTIDGEPVTAIVHLPDLVVAFASMKGDIYVVRVGSDRVIDVFRPSIDHVNGPTIMATVPGTGIVVISQGNNDILVWDISALLIKKRIGVSAPPSRFTMIGHTLFCALANGVVLQISTDTYEVEAENSVHLESSVVAMGEHAGSLYTALSNGDIYLWKDITSPELKWRVNDEVSDVTVHRTLPRVIVITRNSASVANLDGTNLQSLIVPNKQAIRCCFSHTHPMCAIGNSDGTIAVWRIPK